MLQNKIFSFLFVENSAIGIVPLIFYSQSTLWMGLGEKEVRDFTALYISSVVMKYYCTVLFRVFGNLNATKGPARPSRGPGSTVVLRPGSTIR